LNKEHENVTVTAVSKIHFASFYNYTNQIQSTTQVNCSPIQCSTWNRRMWVMSTEFKYNFLRSDTPDRSGAALLFRDARAELRASRPKRRPRAAGARRLRFRQSHLSGTVLGHALHSCKYNWGQCLAFCPQRDRDQVLWPFAACHFCG